MPHETRETLPHGPAEADPQTAAAAAAHLESTELFEQHRAILTGVAYRMLGRVPDAEDVVQDAWLRWSRVDTATVEEPRGYLVRVVTRLAIDRLRQAQVRKESYLGPWLPDPVPTGPATLFAVPAVPDTAESLVLAETVSTALLVVMESLSPLERAVFVLREAFDYPYAKIAEMLDRGEPAVRQLATRARKHVEARRPRFEVDRAEQRRLTEEFLAAATRGDLDGLLALLAEDVRVVGDTNGAGRRGPTRVIVGAAKTSRYVAGIARRGVPGEIGVEFAEINGATAVLFTSDGEPYVVLVLDVSDGRVTTVYLHGNPDRITTAWQRPAVQEGLAEGA